MSDIFSSDAGGSEFVPTSEPAGGSIEPPVPTDSAAIPPQAQPADQATADPGLTSGDGTGQASSDAPTPPAPAAPTADEIARLEQEAETVLADERTPKWYKNVVERVYKPKIDEVKAQVEKYSSFGTPEEVSEAVQLRSYLSEVRSDPTTGMPVRTTANFVKSLYEKDPSVAYQLINDLAVLPSPMTQGLTVSQELIKGLGLDPNRLADIQRFAQNGYSMTASAYAPPDPEDIAQIPEKYHATFMKLDPAVRDSLMSDNDIVRNANLEAHRVRIEREEYERVSEEQRTAQEQQAQEQQQAQFKAEVDRRGVENFSKTAESIMNTFVDSLTKQAGLNKLDAMMVTNTIVNALEPTLSGRMSLETLKAEGIEIDPQAPAIIGKIEELSRHAAYYQMVGDTQSLGNVVADINELQEKLVAKSNKVIASLAQKRNASTVPKPNPPPSAQNRHAIAGFAAGGIPSSVPGQRQDFSDESYAELMAQDPFFRR
jgi:hypothetical protein